MIMKLCESTGLFRTLWCDNDSYFFLKEKEELEMRKKHEEEMKRKQEEFLKQQQEELRQQQLEIQREKEEMERKREALERETALQLQVWVQMKIGYDWFESVMIVWISYDWFEQDIFCDRQ